MVYQSLAQVDWVWPAAQMVAGRLVGQMVPVECLAGVLAVVDQLVVEGRWPELADGCYTADAGVP